MDITAHAQNHTLVQTAKVGMAFKELLTKYDIIAHKTIQILLQNYKKPVAKILINFNLLSKTIL